MSASSLNIFPTFDRHLVLVGCQTFQDFFDLHPQVLKNFDQYEFIKINEGITCADALKMHASRVLALGEDIVNNSGNPDKIRSLLQDLGKHHCQQVRDLLDCLSRPNDVLIIQGNTFDLTSDLFSGHLFLQSVSPFLDLQARFFLVLILVQVLIIFCNRE